MTTYSVTIKRATTDTALPANVKAGGVRFQLLSAADNSVVATYDDPAAGLLCTFPGIADASLIPSVQDLDSTDALLGAAVVAAAFMPSALVTAPVDPVATTYPATASISVSAVAE